MGIMVLTELTATEFTRFSDYFSTHSFYQTEYYASVMQNQGFESVFLGIINEKKQIVAATLVLIDKAHNFKYAYAPRGFLLDYSHFELFQFFTKEIRKYLGKRNVIAIKLNPYILRYTHEPWKHLTRKDSNYDKIFDSFKKLGYRHLGYNHFFEALKPRYEAIIDLEIPEYQLFQNICKKFRTKIRGAERNGISIHIGTVEDLHYLYLQTKKKYPRDLRYFEDCYRYFQKENKIDFYYAKLNTAEYLKVITKKYHLQEETCLKLTQKLTNSKDSTREKYLNQKIASDKLFDQYQKELIYATNLLRNYPDGIVLASTLMIRNYKEVYLLMDGYDFQYKKFNAKHYLLWELCKKYKREGFFKFNLGGMTNPDLQKNPYKGLNLFKTGFHAAIMEYMGDMEFITNNALYFMYRNSLPFRNILKK